MSSRHQEYVNVHPLPTSQRHTQENGYVSRLAMNQRKDPADDIYSEIDDKKKTSKQKDATVAPNQITQKMIYALLALSILCLVVGAVAIGIACSTMTKSTGNSLETKEEIKALSEMMVKINNSMVMTNKEFMEMMISLNESMKKETEELMKDITKINNSIETLNQETEEFKNDIAEIDSSMEILNQSITKQDDLIASFPLGYMELEDGWIAPFNGYQYKANFNSSTWDESRTTCKSWGGDLIVYGARDFATIVTINGALGLPNNYYWIGLSDESSEGNWYWINGHKASTDDVTLWYPGEPTIGSSYDCAVVYVSNSYVYGYLAADNSCTNTRYSICEKLV